MYIDLEKVSWIGLCDVDRKSLLRHERGYFDTDIYHSMETFAKWRINNQTDGENHFITFV